MRSDSRRRIVAKLVADAEAETAGDNLPLPWTDDSVLPAVISPEVVVATAFEGAATVIFLTGDVRSLEIESSVQSVPTHSLVVFPALPRHVSEGSSHPSPLPAVPPFCVILSPEITLRLTSLGIEDITDHLRGKQLEVRGTVERLQQEPPLTGLIYRIWVNSLDQLVRIDRDSADK